MEACVSSEFRALRHAIERASPEFLPPKAVIDAKWMLSVGLNTHKIDFGRCLHEQLDLYLSGPRPHWLSLHRSPDALSE